MYALSDHFHTISILFISVLLSSFHFFFFFSSRRRHTRFDCDWSSDVCSSDLALLHGPLSGLFGGVHLLPFFTPIDGADAGFDPVDHTEVDSRLGDWGVVRALGEEVELVADLIVNHVSIASPQFRDFSRKGADSAFAGMFLTYDRVFPAGASEADLLSIYRPRPGLPFTNAMLETGEKRILWTTFTPQQIDIDVQHPKGKAYLRTI